MGLAKSGESAFRLLESPRSYRNSSEWWQSIWRKSWNKLAGRRGIKVCGEDILLWNSWMKNFALIVKNLGFLTHESGWTGSWKRHPCFDELNWPTSFQKRPSSDHWFKWKATTTAQLKYWLLLDKMVSCLGILRSASQVAQTATAKDTLVMELSFPINEGLKPSIQKSRCQSHADPFGLPRIVRRLCRRKMGDSKEYDGQGFCGTKL